MVKFGVYGFVEPDGSDASLIAKLEAEHVPRVGETLILYGPAFGDEGLHHDKEAGESVFSVTDVVYRASISNEKRPADYHEECDVEVHVETAQISCLPIRLWCVCGPSDSASVECENCGRRRR